MESWGGRTKSTVHFREDSLQNNDRKPGVKVMPRSGGPAGHSQVSIALSRATLILILTSRRSPRDQLPKAAARHSSAASGT